MHGDIFRAVRLGRSRNLRSDKERERKWLGQTRRVLSCDWYRDGRADRGHIRAGNLWRDVEMRRRGKNRAWGENPRFSFLQIIVQ